MISGAMHEIESTRQPPDSTTGLTGNYHIVFSRRAYQ
jgi:hypothetical protein